MEELRSLTHSIDGTTLGTRVHNEVNRKRKCNEIVGAGRVYLASPSKMPTPRSTWDSLLLMTEITH